MANPYAYNVLTFAGAALIAQATAANPIVIVGAVSRATAASSDEDLAGKDAAWYTGKTGTIEAVSASANVAKIVARFDPDGARQDAKSIAVTARLASQTDADAIVLTAKSDPDATAILPDADDTLAYVRFPFNIYIQTSGSVQVTPGASASMADLARFVSLHRAGDPTAGDVQTIKGEKTFDSDARFDGAVTVRGGALKTDVLQPYSNGPIEIGNSLTPATDGAFDLGSGDYGFRAAYTNKIAGNGTTDCTAKIGNGNTSATLRLDASTSNEPGFSIDLNNENGDRMAGLWLTKDCQFYMESDLNVTRIGKGSNPIDYVIAYNFTAPNEVSLNSHNANNTTAATINLHSQTTDKPAITAQLEDSSGDVLADVTIDADDSTAMCYLYMDSDIYETCIGKPGNRIDHLYAWDLQGIIPHPTASDEPPVGAITLLSITSSSQNAFTINIGQLLQSGTGGFTVKIAEYQDNLIQVGTRSTTGKYIALIPAYANAHTLSFTFVLAIRVQ